MARRFSAALRTMRTADGTPPTGVAEVAAAAVNAIPGVLGAVICVHGDRDAPNSRLAVSVSDAQALLVEQLEYTAGAGPGLYAAHTGCVVRAGVDLERQWPAFSDTVFARTDVRAVYAAPLSDGHQFLHAALVLYFRDAPSIDALDETELRDVTAAVADAVVDATPAIASLADTVPADTPSSDPLRERLAVNVAVGMVMATLNVVASDALAVLRGFAWSHQTVLEPVAADMISGELPVTSVA
ncbi:ANTAR domain-containing protein [Nakamurella deserti]|uniref:ANTAR domain-containing protein n=1 Tax=Nakamurella deserti TaxID=2164074 RepID=UPI0013006B63|nr:ANTAR domain-containing protein [Nakamurella deserti]